MPTPQPFAHDPEFLDEMFALLATRSRRLALARERRNVGQDDATETRRGRGDPCGDDEETSLDRIARLAAREDRQQAEIDARLAAHRANPTGRQLGLDRLAMAHNLGEDERIVLVSATSFALSEDLAEHVCGDLGTGYAGNGSCEWYMRLLEANSTEDRVRVRRMFRPDAPLIRAGLVILDRHRNDAAEPEDLLWSRLRISQAAFDTIVGVAALTLVRDPK